MIWKILTSESLENKIDKVFSSMACHRSRSGRILKYEEMDSSLREMKIRQIVINVTMADPLI